MIGSRRLSTELGDLIDALNLRLGSGCPPVIVYSARHVSREEEISLMRHARALIVKRGLGEGSVGKMAGALDAGMQAAWLVRDERPWEAGTWPQLIVPNLHALCMALEGR